MGNLALLFELLPDVQISGLLQFVVVNHWLGLLDSPHHTHVLIENFEALHQPQLAILQFLVGDRIGDISQPLRLLSELLKLPIS